MRLRELRERQGLKQSEIADFLRVERSTYVKYERETSEPSIEKLLLLCEFYHVSLDYIIGRTVKKGLVSLDCTEEESKLLFQYRNLNDDGKAYIVQQFEIATAVYKKFGESGSLEVGT